MKRLIDANALRDIWLCLEGNDFKASDFVYSIDAQPTIDAEPVRHGKWRFESIRGHAVMTCSECCKVQDGQTLCFTYCPSCGARMDKERDSDHAGEEIL